MVLLAQLIHARLVLATVLVLAVFVLVGLALATVFVARGTFLLLLARTLAARARLFGSCGRLLLFGVLAVVHSLQA